MNPFLVTALHYSGGQYFATVQCLNPSGGIITLQIPINPSSTTLQADVQSGIATESSLLLGVPVTPASIVILNVSIPTAAIAAAQVL
jgi:hypothetical protein